MSTNSERVEVRVKARVRAKADQFTLGEMSTVKHHRNAHFTTFFNGHGLYKKLSKNRLHDCPANLIDLSGIGDKDRANADFGNVGCAGAAERTALRNRSVCAAILAFATLRPCSGAPKYSACLTHSIPANTPRFLCHLTQHEYFVLLS